MVQRQELARLRETIFLTYTIRKGIQYKQSN